MHWIVSHITHKKIGPFYKLQTGGYSFRMHFTISRLWPSPQGGAVSSLQCPWKFIYYLSHDGKYCKRKKTNNFVSECVSVNVCALISVTSVMSAFLTCKALTNVSAMFQPFEDVPVGRWQCRPSEGWPDRPGDVRGNKMPVCGTTQTSIEFMHVITITVWLWCLNELSDTWVNESPSC